METKIKNDTILEIEWNGMEIVILHDQDMELGLKMP